MSIKSTKIKFILVIFLHSFTIVKNLPAVQGYPGTVSAELMSDNYS